MGRAPTGREIQLAKWKKRALQVAANNSRQLTSVRRRANAPGASSADRQRLQATEGQLRRANQATKQLNAVNSSYTTKEIIAIGAAGTISEQALKQQRVSRSNAASATSQRLAAEGNAQIIRQSKASSLLVVWVE